MDKSLFSYIISIFFSVIVARMIMYVFSDYYKKWKNKNNKTKNETGNSK